MSHHVNFSTHGKELDAAYQAVISEQDDTNWLIYAYDKGTYDLRVQATGDGGLEELSDEFSDGKVQFAYAKVIDPNTELPKFVFIGWCGSGVPELRKAFFNSQLSDVSKFFKSFHVQINARDEADVEPALIMKRVSESSGAKYSVHKEAAKPQPRVAPVGSVYKKEEIPDIAAMQRQSMTKENAPTPVGTNYTPVQTAPKKLEQRWNAAQNQDSGASAVRAERERYEREVVEREKEKARQFTSHQTSDDTSLREEAEARRRQEEEEQRQQREAEQRRMREQQEAAERQQREEEERHRRQQEMEEEEERQRAFEDQERQRALEEQERQRKYEAEQEEIARKQQEEKQRQLQEQERQAEDKRRAQEEHERQEAAAAAERQRQQEEEAKEAQRQEQERQKQAEALHSQLDETADRAVHAAGVASASAATADSHSQGVSAVVMFEYDAGEANEMPLVEGEIITQIDQVDEGWWFGISEDGKKQGLFPANYVQVIEQQEEIPAETSVPPPPSPPPQPQQQQPQPQQQQEKPHSSGNTATALYDYEAEEDNEISFAEGDVITQIEFVSEDWWQGLSADGKHVGLFPANYVELKK